MTISLSPETLVQLEAYNDAENYPEAYELLRKAAAASTDVDGKNAYLWLLGASDIVQQRGPFAELIFSYNRRQAVLRGITLSDAEITAVAQNIAKAVIQNAIDSKAVPSFATIRALDADAAVDIYKNRAPTDTAATAGSAWSAAILMSPFGVDESTRLLTKGAPGTMDTVADLRDVLFADYVFPRAAKDAISAAGSWATFSAVCTALQLPNWEKLNPLNYGKYYSANYTSGNAASSALRQVADFTPEEILNKLAKLAGIQGWDFEATAPLVFKALDGAHRVEWLDASASSKAQTDIAYRYALKELNPFAVLGADYSRFNANGALDLHDPKTGKGELTEAWLRDRAAMLAAVIDYRRRDANDNTIDSTFAFKDAASGINLGPNQLPQVGVIFGSEQGDSLAFTHTRGDKVHLYGGAGNDVLIGGYSDDYLEGGADNDQLRGGAGKDELWGGRGDDQLQGEAGNDTLIGGAGADNLNGGDDADQIYGDLQDTDSTQVTFNDTLDGGGGDDVLYGGGGDDNLSGGGGDDRLVGGAGSDILNGGDNADVVYGDVQNTSSTEVAFNDRLDGGAGNDVLHGGGGDDDIAGGSGQDMLYGGAGNDILRGNDGAGGDRLKGGEDFDTYYADGGDSIFDGDGQGSVNLDGKTLGFATRKKGETAYRDGAGNSYVLNGSRLSVNGALGIDGYSNGDLGIELKEEPDDPDDPDDPPLKDPFKKAESTISPLVLDLDGNGLSTRGIGQGAFFDYDGNGFAERTGWGSPTDGLLVRDLNGDGRIGSGAELFGDRTRLKNGQLAADGFAALADLDDNQDGRLDNRDIAWAGLKLWRDADSDGRTDTGELISLAEAGVTGIATAHSAGSGAGSGADGHGNQHRLQGSFTRADGSSGQMEDIWFRVNPSSTRQENPLGVSAAIREMPNVNGMGNVASLWQVMAAQEAAGSTQLKDLVEQFANEPDAVARQALTSQIIYAWTGVEGIDPASRGGYVGARIVSAIEAFLGETYHQYSGTNAGTNNPGPNAGQALIAGYMEHVFQRTYAELMMQSHMRDDYHAIRYTWDEATQTLKTDLSGVLMRLGEKLAVDREQGKAKLAAFISNLTYTDKLSELDTRTFQQNLAAYGSDVVSVANLAWRNMVATRGNDQLTGDGSDEIIAGWDGDDTVFGRDGSDFLKGEAGNDLLYGEAGSDTLRREWK